jgi:DNA-binding NtrC family response regulator
MLSSSSGNNDSTGPYVTRLTDEPSSLLLAIWPEKPLDLGALEPLLKQAELGLETCRLRAAARLSSPIRLNARAQTVIPGFIVGSPLMLEVIGKIQKIRTSDVTVLITGESGTGKELVARAIHAESARARGIFLPFNCTATPKEIIDSQLFGHRRGSFTGAFANYPGVIRAAESGTLFLDEIGDLSLEVQPKLMRFLQEGEIQPLGEPRPIKVDVRVIAATNSDLERAVEQGRFREDLFHRLNIIRIHVPPLRDRPDEVVILAAHFLEHFSQRSRKQNVVLTQESLDALSYYSWPGNVRQLRNEIERVVAYASEGSRIYASDLSPDVANAARRNVRGNTALSHGGVSRSFEERSQRSAHMQEDRSAVRVSAAVPRETAHRDAGRTKMKDAVAQLERQLILEALARNGGNLTRTADDVGLSRRGLRLKIAQLGIPKDV